MVVWSILKRGKQNLTGFLLIVSGQARLGVGLLRPFGEGELNMSGVFVGRDRPGGRSGIVVFVAMDENDARIDEFYLDESDGDLAGDRLSEPTPGSLISISTIIAASDDRWSASRRRTVSALHLAVSMTSCLL
jgi:hypothetical protein